jgi:hypothetical protein
VNADPPGTTPRFRLAVTAAGLLGFLVVAAATGTLDAVASPVAAAVGLGLAAALGVGSVLFPRERRLSARAEVLALVVGLAVGVLAAAFAPATFGAMTWVLAGTLVPLAVLAAGRPRALARVLARAERGRRRPRAD